MVIIESWQTCGSSIVGLRGFGVNFGAPPVRMSDAWVIIRSRLNRLTEAGSNLIHKFALLVDQHLSYVFLVLGVSLNDDKFCVQ